MVKSIDSRGAYEWMLELSAEGWAWEFLRRNLFYRRDYASFSQVDEVVAAKAALRWGLLQFSDPDIDARMAVVFWNPAHNQSVLPLVTVGEGRNGLAGVKCKVSVLEPVSSGQRHVLYSGGGRFLQLVIPGRENSILSVI